MILHYIQYKNEPNCDGPERAGPAIQVMLAWFGLVWYCTDSDRVATTHLSYQLYNRSSYIYKEMFQLVRLPSVSIGS